MGVCLRKKILTGKICCSNKNSNRLSLTDCRLWWTLQCAVLKRGKMPLLRCELDVILKLMKFSLRSFFLESLEKEFAAQLSIHLEQFPAC